MPRVYPPLEQKSQNHALPPSLVEIVAGFSAGVFSTLAVHPFDVVKTRLQGPRRRLRPVPPCPGFLRPADSAPQQSTRSTQPRSVDHGGL